MRLIDLSHAFGSHMPVYPGDPVPEMTQVATLSEHGYTDFQVKTGMHVGTHVDAPLHFIEGGKRLSEIPVHRFTGNAHLIQAEGRSVIEQDVLEGRNILPGDILLVRTAHDAFFGQETYYLEHPVLGEGFAHRVVELGVGMVGLDTPSPDRAPFAIHKILLRNEVLIIENLTNLSSLNDAEKIEIFAFPPKLDVEASPTRVVARVE